MLPDPLFLTPAHSPDAPTPHGSKASRNALTLPSFSLFLTSHSPGHTPRSQVKAILDAAFPGRTVLGPLDDNDAEGDEDEEEEEDEDEEELGGAANGDVDQLAAAVGRSHIA